MIQEGGPDKAALIIEMAILPWTKGRHPVLNGL
jgi:hypothetical protein